MERQPVKPPRWFMVALAGVLTILAVGLVVLMLAMILATQGEPV